ncbi:hypothetical protein EON63_16965, partial [archaeon]
MQNGRRTKSTWLASPLHSFCYPLLSFLAIYIVTAVILAYVFVFFVRTHRHTNPHGHPHLRPHASYHPHTLPPPPPSDDDKPFDVYSIFDPYKWGYADSTQSLPTQP